MGEGGLFGKGGGLFGRGEGLFGGERRANLMGVGGLFGG